MKKALFLLIFTTNVVFGALEHGGHTHYSLRQLDTGLGREQSLWHTHTTTDIGNQMGISVQMVPFVSIAVDNKKIAQHFSLKKSGSITIASDRFIQETETTLPYHAIKHNSSLAAVEEAATLKLDPSVTIAGVTLSSFHDGAKLKPGLSASMSVPIFYIDAHMNQSGATSTIASYFDGSYSQVSPAQAALAYGKLGGSSSVMLGPISGQLMYNIVENDRSFVGICGGLSVAMLTRHDQHYLLSDYSSAHDNHKVTVGFDAGTTMWGSTMRDTHVSKGELLLNARYSFMFAGTHKRLLGLYADDGSIPAHSSYLMGAQKDVAGVFPMANLLHRDVHVSNNHQLEANVMGAVTWRNWTANLGYGLFARREESVKVADWDDNLYAVAYPTYDTSAAFANSAATGDLAGDDILLNNRFLTSDMLNTHAPASPAQVSVCGFANIGYNGHARGFPLAIGVGLSYDHSLTIACPSMLTVWGKINFSF